MKVILKVNPIQTGLPKARGWEGTYKKAYTLTWNLEKEFKSASKILKLYTSSIKFHWRQQLLSDISKVTDI